MELVFKDINITIGQKVLLQGVCGVARPGDMLAVMGPSGSGKTTLLNTIAGHVPLTSGEIITNNKPVTRATRRKMCYVMQQDIFFPTPTLWDTLMFVANMRLSDKLSNQEKEEIVLKIVEELELKKCLNTCIGGMFVPGLSGGERKRANIACELLTDPELLLLDEPTSGLDSHLAYYLMNILKKYTTKEKKTVVVTIHQPSSQIFHMFDKVLLLCQGKIAYFGKGSKILEHFSGLGYECSLDYNPADFMIEMVTGDRQTIEKVTDAAKDCSEEILHHEGDEGSAEVRHQVNTESKVKVITGRVNTEKSSKQLNGVQLTSYRTTDDNGEMSEDINDETEPHPKYPSSFWTQFKTLTKRNFKYSRHVYMPPLEIIQTFVLAVLCGVLWFQIPRDEQTINDRMGVMFFCCLYWGAVIQMANGVANYHMEIGIINKERASGMYRLSAYYSSKMFSESALSLSLPVVFVIIVYWMAGLNGIHSFFLFILTILLCVFAGQSLTIFLSVLLTDLRTCMKTVTMIMLSSMLAGGFYHKNVPPWISWIQYLSFLNHGFNILLRLEFTKSSLFACASTNQTVFPQCVVSSNSTPTITGEEILEFHNIPDMIWLNVSILIVYCIAFRTGGYLLLRHVRNPLKK